VGGLGDGMSDDQLGDVLQKLAKTEELLARMEAVCQKLVEQRDRALTEVCNYHAELVWLKSNKS
jgi:ribosomal 50S subunit-associated protein YjgA (DUF615 family)